MDATDIVDAVESDLQTELSRLGSSKSIYAATAGELEPDQVLGAMATPVHHAETTLHDWDEGGPDVFGDAADRLAQQYDTLVGELGDHDPGETPAAVKTLAAANDPAARLGALLGWVLVIDRKAGQVTGFFTGQADPQTASLVRGFGEDFEAIQSATIDAIADEAVDAEAAADAAGRVVEAAYDEYFETLEDLGVNPKPVC